MKKLFKAIRSENLEEVKAIIEKKPEEISCVATPPPKKDIGQSPLQVAVKIGAFDIAYYLIEQGADVNFMEAKAEGVSWRMPILHDAIRTVLQSLCYKNFQVSDAGLKLVHELLKRGADPNKCASNGFAALDECVARAECILEYKDSYPEIQEIAEKQLVRILTFGHIEDITPNRVREKQIRYVIWMILYLHLIELKNILLKEEHLL